MSYILVLDTTFWCKPIGELPKGAAAWLQRARQDGCVSFCGDSIAAGLISTSGVRVDQGGSDGR